MEQEDEYAENQNTEETTWRKVSLPSPKKEILTKPVENEPEWSVNLEGTKTKN